MQHNNTNNNNNNNSNTSNELKSHPNYDAKVFISFDINGEVTNLSWSNPVPAATASPITTQMMLDSTIRSLVQIKEKSNQFLTQVIEKQKQQQPQPSPSQPSQGKKTRARKQPESNQDDEYNDEHNDEDNDGE